MSICDVYLDVNEKRFSIRDIFYQRFHLKEKKVKKKFPKKKFSSDREESINSQFERIMQKQKNISENDFQDKQKIVFFDLKISISSSGKIFIIFALDLFLNLDKK